MKNCILLLLMAATVPATAQKKADRKTLDNLQATVNYLASDSLEGRRTGTPGERLAGAWIAKHFEQDGIAPKGDSGYAQVFTVKDSRETASSAQLVINGNHLTPGEQFFALPFSASKSAKGDIIPHVNEPNNIWLVNLATLENKNAPILDVLRKQAVEAAKTNASAIVFYNGKIPPSELEKWTETQSKTLSIPAVYVREEPSKKWMGDDVSDFQVSLQVSFTPVHRTGMNVIGFVDNHATQTIIIGAHYDHLGYGEDHNSLYTGPKAMHHGADDNASGVAAMLELGRLLKGSKLKNNNYLFIAFSGKEEGLLGSKYFTHHTTIDSASINCMINLEMVGRLDASKGLSIAGEGTSPAWQSLTAEFTRKNIVLNVHPEGKEENDQLAFYNKNVPALSISTGQTDDYHRPSDSVDKINYNGMLDIVKIVYSIVDKINAQSKLAFTSTEGTINAPAPAKGIKF